MLTYEQKLAVIDQVKNGTYKRFGSYLSDNPTMMDVIPFLQLKNIKKWLHNKRYCKKLVRNLSRYLPKHIYYEFMAKVFVRPLLPRLNYSELARKLVVVQPLPDGAIPIYDKQLEGN